MTSNSIPLWKLFLYSLSVWLFGMAFVMSFGIWYTERVQNCNNCEEKENA